MAAFIIFFSFHSLFSYSPSSGLCVEAHSAGHFHRGLSVPSAIPTPPPDPRLPDLITFVRQSVRFLVIDSFHFSSSFSSKIHRCQDSLLMVFGDVILAFFTLLIRLQLNCFVMMEFHAKALSVFLSLWFPVVLAFICLLVSTSSFHTVSRSCHPSPRITRHSCLHTL